MRPAQKPVVGRHVWYCGKPYGGARYDVEQPMHAVICYVWNDRLVNLIVTDHEGQTFSVLSVHLRQRGDAAPLHTNYCEWPRLDMPLSGHEADVRLQASLAGFDEALADEAGVHTGDAK